eukprot:1159186-Rhodomonas_salina.1
MALLRSLLAPSASGEVDCTSRCWSRAAPPGRPFACSQEKGLLLAAGAVQPCTHVRTCRMGGLEAVVEGRRLWWREGGPCCSVQQCSWTAVECWQP